MRGKLKLVIFDLDGVLIDSEPVHDHSIRQVVERLHMKPFDPSQNFGMSSEAMFSRLIAENGLDTTPEALVELMTDFDEAEIREKRIGATEGLYTLLDRLQRAGVLLGVASSSERRFVDMVLGHLGLRDRFAFTAAGTEAPRKKPAPDLYQRVMRLAGAEPEHCAAIEDSPTGIRAAHEAGLYCIGYQNPNGHGPRLDAADAVIPRLLDAADLLLGN